MSTYLVTLASTLCGAALVVAVALILTMVYTTVYHH